MPPNLGFKAASRTAEANEERRRVEAEKNALALRASMLAPQLAALEEGRATLEGFQREGVCFCLPCPFHVLGHHHLWHSPARYLSRLLKFLRAFQHEKLDLRDRRVRLQKTYKQGVLQS